MRWGALAIQAASILVAERLLGLELPTGWMWGLLAIGAASNVWLSLGSVEALGGFLVLDVALLTGVLYLSGGPTNPFSVIYVVYIAMSAVMLSTTWTWTIAALSMVSFGALFYSHIPAEGLGHQGHGEDFQIHLYGMFVAFTLAALLIAYFVSRLSDALRERERALAEVQERTHRWGKLASIATLAAGAAHELGTPLGTIAIAANEVRRRAEGVPGGEALVEDADLIREELERCRAVLDRMALAGGEHVGETSNELTVEELFSEVRTRLRTERAKRWETRTNVGTLSAPRQATLQLIENIARNGFDACESGRVSLDVEKRVGEVDLRFVDEGSGMSAEVAKRATDPFFTTKSAGDHMGLGLFLARTLVDSLGGRLTIESVVDQGTTIRVVLPQNT
jgi:two-component system sensor histidine kinase RegB